MTQLLLNIVVVGSEEAIIMIEAGGLEVSEDTIGDALSFGHEQIRRIIAAIRELHDQIRPNKVKVAPLAFNEEVLRDIEKRFGERLHDSLDTVVFNDAGLRPETEHDTKDLVPLFF